MTITVDCWALAHTRNLNIFNGKPVKRQGRKAEGPKSGITYGSQLSIGEP